jgi:hypothetical protein
MPAEHFIFRSTQTIGAAAAENDDSYLKECFIDTGILTILRDCSDHRCILVGRTGAGKSALIAQLRDESEHAIRIQPDALSLAYISNSAVIKFFSDAGVNLNLFYRLLWRHIFVVEILKERFGLDSEHQNQSFILGIWNTIRRNRKNEMALDYLKEWGDSFWRETDYRVKEVTNKLERDLQAAIEGAVPGIGKLSVTAAKKLTTEQKEEIVNRAQEVVSSIQIKELSAIIDLLDEVLLSDRKKRYYITIDNLDEDWVEEKLRLHLIRALIETSLEFTRLDNVKAVIALRSDLLDRVYRFTRDPGFQEEKYRTSSLDFSWQRDDLIAVLDSRIDKLVRGQYTKTTVTHKDLLMPLRVNKKKTISTIDYMLERTLQRPRDLIQFFNICITQSNGKTIIDNGALLAAEGIYSRERFRALVDEWVAVYPNLGLSAQILRKRSPNFKIQDLPAADIEESCLQSVISSEAVEGADLEEMKKVAEDLLHPEIYRKYIIFIFYKVGLVGLRTNSSMPISWSFLGGASVSAPEIEDDSRAYIHPTFWRHFGISDARFDIEA